MSGSLTLLVVVVLSATPPSSGQADGSFWWRSTQSPSGAQQDSVLPGTIPPAEYAPVVGEQAAARPPPPGAQNAANAASGEGNSTDCICIDYYLCGADGYIITTGEGIVDIRSGLVGPPCSGIQVCCKPPRRLSPDTTTTSTTTTTTAGYPLYPDDDCGIRGGDEISNMVDLRIISESGRGNGSTQFAEFPWMLVLLKSRNSSSSSNSTNMFVCGASLVHPQVAMTAAHCLSRKRVSELKVRAGEWDTQSSSEPLPHQDRRVSRVLVHPGFYEGTLYYDVALLFLKRPFELARNVRPLCLPQQGDVLEGGSTCIATGWGRNSFGPNGTFQMTMKKVELPVVNHGTCQAQLRNTRLSEYFNLHESFVCAGGERGQDTCQGDGGGPLFCRSPSDNGRYIQLGITSWGIGCGDTDIPAVYANVPSFADWVNTQLPQASDSANIHSSH